MKAPDDYYFVTGIRRHGMVWYHHAVSIHKVSGVEGIGHGTSEEEAKVRAIDEMKNALIEKFVPHE